MGCNSESKEYSVFVETGCKPHPVIEASFPQRLRSPPETLVEFEPVKGLKLNHIEKTVNQKIAFFDGDEAEFALATSEFEKKMPTDNPLTTGIESLTLIDEFALETIGETESIASGFGELERAVAGFESASEEWTTEFVVDADREFESVAGGFGELEQAVAGFESANEEWTTEFVVDGGNELERVLGGFGSEEIKDEIAIEAPAVRTESMIEEESMAFTDSSESKVKASVADKPPAQELEIRLLLGLELPSWIQPNPPPVDPVEPTSPASVPARSNESYSLLKRVTVRHVVGDQERDCIPFATNFTSLEIFTASDYQPNKMFPFLDLRGHRFDNNTYAANVGIGGRYVPKNDSGFCEMLGLNIYYDYRQGCVGYYQQIGAGIEVLGRRWDFRANAYAPFGARRHIKTCFFNDYEGDFFAKRQDIESVSYSFNGEVGYLAINGKNFSFYMAGGPYFLARGRCCTSTVGVEARIRPKYRDYVALDLSARYDDLFGTIWQASIIFTLPLYQISNLNERPCGLRDWQIYQPVERFEVMPLSKRSCWETNF